MRRFTTVLLAVAIVLMWSVPGAAAEKPAQPTDSPTRYDVEITSTDAVSTSCGTALTVTRNDERNGRVTHFESTGATLAVAATGLTGNGYPIDVDCHGSLTTPEYFRITLEDDGTVAMLWIFDAEVHETIVTLKNGRQKIKTARTDFRMGGPYDNDTFAKWSQTTSTTTEGKETINIHGDGQFHFVHFQSGGHPSIDGQPLFVDVATPSFTLDITLTEIAD